MNINNLPSEDVAVGGVIDPDAYAASAYTSDYIDMGLYQRAMGILLVGDFVATGLADASLVQATDSSGTGVKAITGKSITQLTAAGSDDNKQAILNVRSEELDVDNGFTHVALKITLTTAGADMAGILLGLSPRLGPANVSDLASVDEIVN